MLGIIAFASLLLWQHPWGSVLLYPFTILSTWFHEMGHGLAAMLLGSTFEQLLIFEDGSGIAVSLRSANSARLGDAFIAASGPMGPPIAGAVLIAASRRRRTTRWALAALGGVILLSTLIWVRTAVGWAVLPIVGMGILVLAWRASVGIQAFAIQLLGVQACISTYRQTGYLFSQGGIISGDPQRSDTQVMAEVLLLPYWFWACAITVAIIALLWASLSYALR